MEYSAFILFKKKFKKRKEKQFSVAYVITELMLFAFTGLALIPVEANKNEYNVL